MAVTIESLTGQDSPNSGRLKVNTNFINCKIILDAHQTYLTALSGDVVSTDAAQTIINKIITSNNATSGAGNDITIAREDFYGDMLGVANTYSGISYNDAKIHNISTANNVITISGFGGIEPSNDTTNRVIGIGFPQNAYLDHPDGVQSLVINSRSRLGAAILDINGLTTVRDSVEIGDASDGVGYEQSGIKTLLHIKHGLDGSSRWTDLNIESRGSDSVVNNGPFINLMRNPNQSPMQDGWTLGGITFRGNYASGGTTYNSARSATRIEAKALNTYAIGDRQATIDFYSDAGGTATAERIMRIMGGDLSEGGSGVIIGKDTTNTGHAHRSVLTVVNEFSGSYSDTSNAAKNLTLLDDDYPGLAFVGSNSVGYASIVFQREDVAKGKFQFDFGTDKYVWVDSSDAEILTLLTTEPKLGLGVVTPTYNLQAHGPAAGSPYTTSTDILRINTGILNSNPGDNDEFTIFTLPSSPTPYNIIKFGNASDFRITDDDSMLQKDILRYDNSADQTTLAASRFILQNPNGSDSTTAQMFLSQDMVTGDAAHAKYTHSVACSEIRIEGYGFVNSGDGVVIKTNNKTKFRSGSDGVHIGCTEDNKHAAPGLHHQSGEFNSGLKAGVITYGPVLMALGSPDMSTSSAASSLGDAEILYSFNATYYGSPWGDARQITIVDGNDDNACADGGLIINTGSHSGMGGDFGIHDTAIASFRQTATQKPLAHFGLNKFQNQGNENLGNIDLQSTVVIAQQDNNHALGVFGTSEFEDSVEMFSDLTVAGSIVGGGMRMESTSDGILVNDLVQLSSSGEIGFVVEQTGAGSAKRTAGMSLKRSGSSATPGALIVGAHPASAGGATDDDLEIIFNSTSAIRLPSGTTAQRPGGGSSDYAAVEGQLRWNTSSDQLEYYNGSTWVNAGAPPVGWTMVQFGPSGLDNSPGTLYPGTTWVSNDIPADSFIRNVGENNSTNTRRGARNYMVWQRDMVAQHTHRSTAANMGASEWGGDAYGRVPERGGSAGSGWSQLGWPYGDGSFYNGRNYSYWPSMHGNTAIFGYNTYEANFAEAFYGTFQVTWEASESHNNAYLPLYQQGVETGRIVSNTDRRTPVGHDPDGNGFDPVAGTGRVQSYGGSNGIGGFWAGYIGDGAMPYHTGREVRPHNVAVKFWRRTA